LNYIFSLNIFVYNKMNNSTIIISIDGNIGSGKSTLYKDLQDYYTDNEDIGFCPEPVDSWTTIIDEKGVPILTNLYSDTKKYAFRFQMMAYISRLHLLRLKMKENKYKVIISERSVQTDRNVFAKMLFDDGLIELDEYTIYNKWFDEFLDDLKLGGIIYVKADSEVCDERVKIRSREGENIPLEYLKKCHNYHETWLETKENKLVINANIDTCLEENIYIRKQWISTIDTWITELLPTSIINTNNDKFPILEFDGACRGNPSDYIGIGCIIYNNEKILHDKSEYFTSNIVGGTNNVAEYKALIEGLRLAIQNNITNILVKGDSQLIINQMTGKYKVKADKLIPLYNDAKDLERQFTDISYQHIKREFNKQADKLANLALDNICPGCYPIYQANQLAHIGPNGCLGSDEDDLH